METIISFVMLLVSLLVLTISRIKGLYILKVIFKTTSSLLFLAVAHFARKECQKENKTTYFKLMFLGLFFSLLGDVFLVIEGIDIFFILGVFSFACAHIFYIIAFFQFGKMGKANLISTIVFFSILLFLTSNKEWVDLGEMKPMIMAYAVLLSLMAAKSFSALKYYRENPYFVTLTILGAVLFFISDGLLLFAFFGKQDLSYLETVNNPIYYVGQGLFGLSFRKEPILKKEN